MLSLMSYKHIDFVAQRDQYSLGSLQRLVIADGGESVSCERDFDAPFPTNVKYVVSSIKKTGSEFIDIASMNPVQKLLFLIAIIPPPFYSFTKQNQGNV